MKLYQDKVEVPLLALSFVEDLTQYYSVFQISTYALLKSEGCYLETSTKLPLRVIKTQFTGKYYTYTAVSENTYKVFNSVTNGFTGRATVKKLCNNLGFRTKLSTDSVETWWCLPQCGVVSLINTISKYAKFGNGGGVYCRVDLDGNIVCIDLKKVFSGKSLSLYGNVLKDTSSIDWIVRHPGKFKLLIYDDNGISTEDYIIKEGYGKLISECFDTTGLYKDLYKQKLLNEFYRSYFSSRTVILNPNSQFSINLGTLVNINDLGTNFLIKGYTLEYPLDNTATRTTLELITCE